MSDPSALDFQSAQRHHGAGRLADAERLYRRLLAAQPNHAGAMHGLGLIAHQMGHHQFAANWIRQAIAINPNEPALHSNLGEALRNLGLLEQAIDAYLRAIALQPSLSAAHFNLGQAFAGLGKFEQAIEAYRQALQYSPHDPDTRLALAHAYNNLGVNHRRAKKFDEAASACRLAIELMPQFPEAHSNLGNSLRDMGNLSDAADAYRTAVHFKPDYANAWCNLGNVLREQGKLADAAAACKRAIDVNPSLAEAYCSLGIVLLDQGHHDEALRHALRAIDLKPDLAKAHNAVANVLKDQGMIDEALAAYSRAISFDPEDAGVASNRLLALHCKPDLSAEAIFSEHRRWDETYARRISHPATIPSSKRDLAGKPLKIGLVSADFRWHPVGRFIAPLLEHHDRDAFQFHCYDNSRAPDEFTKRLRIAADKWHDIAPLSDDAAAEVIRADGIDILIDLAGHTAHNRLGLLARRPAPLQGTYLGYPDTTGMSAMDFRITDPHADPPGMTDACHTERLLRLPETFLCFPQPDSLDRAIATRAEAGTNVTFGSFNDASKISGATLAMWSQILQQIPSARLMLKSWAMGSAGAQRRLLDLFSRHGIAGNRVEFRGMSASFNDHLRLYDRLDIALDTYPYHGTTTTCEALWMGVPVVTLAGKTHASRVGVSILTNAGLPELIATSPDQCVHTAVALAQNLPRLADVRAHLRNALASSPLMDAPRFTRNFEAALLNIRQNQIRK